MDRVLIDGTTVMSALRLVRMEERPTAVNVQALSLLVEAMVLHNTVLVLDTQQGDDRLQSAAHIFGPPLTVEKRRVAALVDSYVALEVPELHDIQDLGFEERHKIDEQRKAAFKTATNLLIRSLSRRRVGEDLGNYLEQIDEAHRRQFDERQNRIIDPRPLHKLKRPWRLRNISEVREAVSEAFVPLSWLGGGWGPTHDGTPLGTIGGDYDSATAWRAFVERYSNAGSQSPWHEASRLQLGSALQFTDSLLVRTHLYLIASEVLDAPYRPDLLRSPICMKFFADKITPPDTAERLLQLATEGERRRVDQAGDVFAIRQVLVVPLLLSRVMKAARRPRDLISEIRDLRASRPATKFRDHVSELREAADRGSGETLIKAMQQYAEALGGDTRDLAEVGQVAIKIGASVGKLAFLPNPGSVLSLTSDVGTGSFTISRMVGRSWRARKTALISQSVRSSRESEGLQPALKRLFGRELPDADMQILRAINFPT